MIDELSKAPNGVSGTLTPIGDTDSVRFVTNDFMYTGGDGYTVFASGTNVAQPGDDLLQVTIDYITAHLAGGSEGRRPHHSGHSASAPTPLHEKTRARPGLLVSVPFARHALASGRDPRTRSPPSPSCPTSRASTS